MKCVFPGIVWEKSFGKLREGKPMTNEPKGSKEPEEPKGDHEQRQ